MQTRDCQAPLCSNLGHIVHIYVPLSRSSVIWYWPKGSDGLELGSLQLMQMPYTYNTYIHKEYLYRAKEQKSHNAPRSQLQASPNKYVFSFCLKTRNVRFGRRSSAGSSFHNRGPAAVKLLSPNRLCVAGTDSIWMSSVCRWYLVV